MNGNDPSADLVICGNCEAAHFVADLEFPEPDEDTNTQFGQLQIHRFVNPSGMLAVGSNVMRPTDASGQPFTGTPGSQGLGTLKQGFIERSNVQIVNELVNLIVAQRAYEVNSRAIQASDQMLSTATNLSR